MAFINVYYSLKRAREAQNNYFQKWCRSNMTRLPLTVSSQNT